MEQATEKQLKYIAELQEMSIYPLPSFLGHTQDEASEYIDRYSSMAHENAWAITYGYQRKVI